MPSYIVTFKPETPDSEMTSVKDGIVAQGGSIDHEYTLIKGFSAILPDNHVNTLSNNPHVENMERDQEMTTQ